MTFKNSDGGFSHIENGKSNNIACYQALNSLVDLYKYMSKGNTEIFEFDDTKKNNSNSENSRQNTENSNTDSSEVNIDSNNKNNSVNTGDITEKHNSQVDEEQQETTVKPESNNAENYDDQVMALADDNYEPFTLASTPDSVAAANSDDDNNFIFYVSLIGLVAVAAVLLIIRLTVLKKTVSRSDYSAKEKVTNNEIKTFITCIDNYCRAMWLFGSDSR